MFKKSTNEYSSDSEDDEPLINKKKKVLTIYTIYS